MRHTFAHDGLAIAVDAPDGEIAWLSEFLGPSFTRATADPHAVIASHDSGTNAQFPHQSAPTRITFSLDSGPMRLPASPIAGGVRLHDTRTPTVFDVTDNGARVRIRAAGLRINTRMRLMRVIREYAHNHSVSTGGLMLHAAAVTVDRVAVAIAGSKGAGKTTLALRLLASPGVGYLSNDRVLVRSEDRPTAVAVPTVVSVREGTRTLLPDLAARLRACGDFTESDHERLASGASAPIIDGDVWRVSPAQLCAALERPAAASAPLAAIFFPAHDRGHTGSIRRLTHDEAAVAIAETVLCRASRAYTSEVFVTSPAPATTDAEIEARSHALASRVACFVGTLPDAASPEDAATLLRACLPVAV